MLRRWILAIDVMPAVVVLDACVLYSAPLRDFLLHVALQGVIEPVWSSEILDEFTRNLLENRPDLSAERLSRTCMLMNQYFPASCVDAYHHRMAGITLPDPGDHHVLALAVEANASTILTFNLRDFPQSALASLGVEAVHPDKFLCARLELYVEQLHKALEAQSQMTRRPHHSPAEVAHKLVQCGLTLTGMMLASRYT